MEFRDEAEHNDEQLTPYSFRHRYAKGIHDQGASEELREVQAKC